MPTNFKHIFHFFLIKIFQTLFVVYRKLNGQLHGLIIKLKDVYKKKFMVIIYTMELWLPFEKYFLAYFTMFIHLCVVLAITSRH